MIRRLALAAFLAGTTPALAMPDFVPKPAEVYEGYVALEVPRTEVPVGALWIQDYGPSGEGAAADNLVTERSLSQVTISSDLQLGLTAGILNFFGLDPSYRNRLSARFGDLSIVRVKDMSRLSGPGSEPRIYEAVRAGTITITTDNDVGLKLETRALGQNLPVVGRSDNGSRRSFSIDGKEMFIAFRVASQEEVRGEPEDLKLRKAKGGWAGTSNGRNFVIQGGEACSGTSSAAQTKPAAAVRADAVPGDLPLEPTNVANPPKRIALPAQAEPQLGGESRPLTLPLRIPIADGKGGLLDNATLYAQDKRSKTSDVASQLCTTSAAAIRATVQLVGRRLHAFKNPKAPRW